MIDAGPDELQATVADAFVYAYPMLFNYKTLHEQALDPAFPGYVGGFGRFRHYSRVYTPADTDIVTANNDTPYSWAWLDLRAEPWVLTMPPVPGERYVTFQWFDLFTYNFAYVGVLSTGRAGGRYLFAGPGWDGAVPDGIDGVFRSETELIGCLGRTSLDGPEDLPNVQALQQQYTLTPLHEIAGIPSPPPAPPVDWPAWDEQAAVTRDFIAYLNFLLQFCRPDPSEADLLARFARAGIAAGRSFDPGALTADQLAAVDAGVAQGRQTLADSMHATHSSIGLFGSRDTLGNDYLRRATAAAMGIYGNNVEEAVYVGWIADDDGKPLTGDHSYEVRFPAGALPPVKLFWSITMYELPSRLLVDNPIDRYSIGDRTSGLVHDADGSLTLTVQHARPDDPDRAANWLPAPPGPFTAIFRLYGPEPSVVDGTWTQPPMRRITTGGDGG
ncbi:DUF1254 domain-containing protein [Actinomycetospora sp. CA-101289]|uniref:DUF1254 domain-containing protein n=1 Tax=Actinomycetospora sp. CA-101289 TaxID=3239893 RepID=UPI003D9768F4